MFVALAAWTVLEIEAGASIEAGACAKQSPDGLVAASGAGLATCVRTHAEKGAELTPDGKPRQGAA